MVNAVFRRLLVSALMAMMAFIVMTPMVSTLAPNFAIDEIYNGGDHSGNTRSVGEITYSVGAGDTPGLIAAIWETVSGGLEDLDDDETKTGCQVNPPMRYGQYSSFWIYVAIFDPDDEINGNDDVKISISWPKNDLSSRLGVGGYVIQNLHPTDATFSEFQAASEIDGFPNEYFICYFNDFNYDNVVEEYSQINIKFKKVEWNMYYHWPAGWYDARVTIQGSNTFDQCTNYFEYVLGVGVEIDFSDLDFGEKDENEVWYKYDGNWVWDPGNENPTVRNIGNWDSELGVYFTNGSFWWDPPIYDDVYFDVRVGNCLPGDPRYNKSYMEIHPIECPYGLEPNKNYFPLPINNTGSDYDDALWKCNQTKLNFYLYPKQWSIGQAEYTFNIFIFINAPDWLPEERDPVQPEQPPGWFNNSWTYRKQLHLTNPKNNYPIELNISYDNILDGEEDVSCGGNCNNDFSDLRFTESDGTTSRDYFILEKIDGDYVLVLLNTSYNNFMYMYYGNSGTSGTSNPDGVYLFYDDFEDGVINTSRWEYGTEGSGANVVETNGRLNISAAYGHHGGAWARSNSSYRTFTNNVLIEKYAYYKDDAYKWFCLGTCDSVICDGTGDTIPPYNYPSFLRLNNSYIWFDMRIGANHHRIGIVEDSISTYIHYATWSDFYDQWNNITYIYLSDGTIEWKDEGVDTIGDVTDISFRDDKKDLFISQGSYDATRGGWIDMEYIRVRWYCPDDEPSWVGFGIEQVNS